MNRYAYLTTSLAIRTFYDLSKTRIHIHGQENIPMDAANIYVINHFTRIETLFLPYHIHRITRKPVWSLADYSLFTGALGTILEKMDTVSTKNPDRDRLIVKSLLAGEASWIIFPEGSMIKSKKIFEKGRFKITTARGQQHRPHTGAAALALRTEFYRERMRRLRDSYPEEIERLLGLFKLPSLDAVLKTRTCIVPVNVTYYPIRARENVLSKMALQFFETVSDRMMEEIMTEGTMILSGVDMDVRFGKPIPILDDLLKEKIIIRDMSANRPIQFDESIHSKQKLRGIAVDIMERYMRDIYAMTTINHDHLFAAILKHMPSRAVNAYDLRLKVFWASLRNMQYKDVFFHHSLETDQIHLLTDDRYKKFENFIALALMKKVVTLRNNILLKDISKFFSTFDFHRVRIDNPIAVIANEIEPLTLLQRRLKRIAWTPGYILKKQVAQCLLRQAMKEFETDYQTYYIEGESKAMHVGAPFLLKGGFRQKTGVVLVHGYLASPLEVRELAMYLNQKGYWVYAPRLKGHGTSPDDLATRSYTEWQGSVEMGFAIMRNLCERIFVGGFSTGAGLALDLASRIKKIHGVFAIAPPLCLQDFSAKFVPAMDIWNKFMAKFNLETARKDFIDNKPEHPHINYLRNPISGMRELERLMDAVESGLPHIQMPAVVIQGDRDPVVNPKGSRQVFERIGSAQKEYIAFHFNRHGILMGEQSTLVHEAVYHFIRHCKDVF